MVLRYWLQLAIYAALVLAMELDGNPGFTHVRNIAPDRLSLTLHQNPPSSIHDFDGAQSEG